MTILPRGYENQVAAAVKHYWSTLKSQSVRQKSGDADRGGRAAVTGGKQMDGFCVLMSWVLQKNGLSEANIYAKSRKEIPGFFRPTKDWDLIVVHNSTLVAAIEFKSQKGPSFGNNFNNRTEEAVGNAVDLWTAYREQAYGRRSPKPWLGWIMLLEECAGSTSTVRVAEPHFEVSKEFKNTSYLQRYELLLRKLMVEKLYDGTAFITSNEAMGLRGRYNEPAHDLSMKKFLTSIGAHVRAYLESL